MQNNFCRFYGISAVNLIILNPASFRLEGWLEPFNNINDIEVIKNLKWELHYLLQSLNNLEYNYTDKSLRRLELKVKLKKLKGAELDDAIKQLESAEKSLATIQKSGSVTLKLSPYELQILEYLVANKDRIYSIFQSLNTNISSEKRLLSSSINELTYPHNFGWNLLRYIKNSLTANPSIEIYNQRKAQIKTQFNEIVSMIRDDEEEQYVETDIYQYKLPEFLDTFVQQNNISTNYIRIMEDVYNAISPLIKNPLEFYVDRLGLRDAKGNPITEEEFYKIQEVLEQLGIVGMNLYTLEFLKENIGTYFLYKPSKAYIKKNSQIIDNLKLINRYLSNDLRLGDRLPPINDIIKEG